MLDEQGMVWFTHFAEQFLGKMDPKTGQVWEFPIPVLKPGYPVGTLDLGLDKDGNLWIGMMYQSGVARFDKKTETFKTWSMPKEWQTDAAQTGHLDPSFTHVDGKVWVKNSDRSQILRLDIARPANGRISARSKTRQRQTPFGIYGIRADSENNLYLLDFQSSNIGKIDAKTKQFTVYRGEIANSRPRRGAVDDQNRLWYAEYAGNAVGMVDPKTEQIKEWVLPTPWAQPYDVVRRQERRGLDRLDDERPRVAARSEDRPVRGVSTAQDHQHPPRVRGQSTTPVTFWAGSNHGASIVKLEPLD